jgi:hypothetical protein
LLDRSLFAGLNVGIVLSITGALLGELIGADRGLGNLLLQLNYNMDISGMFAVLLVLAVLGIHPLRAGPLPSRPSLGRSLLAPLLIHRSLRASRRAAIGAAGKKKREIARSLATGRYSAEDRHRCSRLSS